MTKNTNTPEGEQISPIEDTRILPDQDILTGSEDETTPTSAPPNTSAPPKKETWVMRLNPLWYVIIGLVMLQLLTIYLYEKKIDRILSPSSAVFFQRDHHQMHMESLVRSHEDWARQEPTPRIRMNQIQKSYAGMQMIGDDALQYKIRIQNNLLSGELISSNPDILNDIHEKIEALGYTSEI